MFVKLPKRGVTNALLVALLACGGWLGREATALAGGDYYAVRYEPSLAPGELQFGVTFTLWIPKGTKHLRGVIVHQHGCGKGACQGGQTAAYDLHWQALAAKWNCALLGPSYEQEDGENCRLWCDPRNGSDAAFQRALADLAAKSEHTELPFVPWCLWGHSGGAFWSSLMQTMHPERIAAIWFRSGTAFATWQKGEIPKPEIPAAAYGIPAMCNPGAKENGDPRFSGAWTGALAMFEAYRAQGAPIGFAPDPRTGHECGDSRYLAIPFFDACLAARLPSIEESASAASAGKIPKLQAIDAATGWRAALLGDTALPAAEFQGDAGSSVWLPNEAVAKAWEQYVSTGVTQDTTPPAPPYNVRLNVSAAGERTLTWEADADFESGLQAFVIRRGGKELARLPKTPRGRIGRPLFQGMSYHDTPETPLAEMKFALPSGDAPEPGADDDAPLAAEFEISALNGAGLESKPARAAAE